MNAPHAHESFILEEGEEKISIQRDTRQPNTIAFTIRKEDHTMGNMLKHQLLKNPRVIFVGYYVPHPLEHNIVLRVKTTADTTPYDALQQGIKDIRKELKILKNQFSDEDMPVGVPEVKPEAKIEPKEESMYPEDVKLRFKEEPIYMD
ncbi:hypothetical protein L596_012144 [Steinernema carpocapsae]|uniref:DNA-directed RNA polymerase RBP11-like dimerisation domain-containing protein n=1 Tax=Steinernema carpocapsae TaxID=34508 RepID=A0A4U5NWZ1_STECR|nr:hypothetical protein L596_012144 [Steinernema carpocapsae]